MNLVGSLSRSVALAGLLLATPLAAAPALAAKADVDLLQSYVGDWKGSSELKGKLRGKEGGKIACQLSLTRGNGDKVNYQGRCAVAGTTLSVTGTLVYNDKAGRYEAVMTSNVAFSGVATGKRQGNGILFNFKERNKDEEGNDLSVAAAISLQPEKMGVDFNVVFNGTGDELAASVPFSR